MFWFLKLIHVVYPETGYYIIDKEGAYIDGPYGIKSLARQYSGGNIVKFFFQKPQKAKVTA